MTSFLASSAVRASSSPSGVADEGVGTITTRTTRSLYSLLVYEQIVREVVFKKDSQDLAKIPTLSQYHKIQNRKLTSKQIAWTDERKAVSTFLTCLRIKMSEIMMLLELSRGGSTVKRLSKSWKENLLSILL